MLCDVVSLQTSYAWQMTVEPTGVLGLAAAVEWLKTQSTPQNVLIVVRFAQHLLLLLVVNVALDSGGNIAFSKRNEVWNKDVLERVPSLSIKFAPKNE